MDLPVIDTPVFPRWVWIDEITYSHIPIATIITAFMILSPICEYIGYRKNDLRYERLAKGWIWFTMILFSPGAALGTGIAVYIIGTYPEFWSRWSNLFFWPLMFQFMFFLAEVGFLFFGYYLSWDRLMSRKRLHIFFGVMAAFFGLLVQMVWDGLGSYMLTPGQVPLPDVDQPVGWSAAAFFNPSFPYLFMHRIFGNFSYVMLLVGGVYALRYMRQKDPEEKKYLGWASDLMFTTGFLCFFAMPLIGWFYASVIQREAPVAFHAIMGGHVSVHFIVKMGAISLMLVLGGLYLFVRHKQKAILVALTVGLLGLLIVLHVHPPLDWFGGSERTWRVAVTAFPLMLVALAWLLHGRANPERKYWQWAMFITGLAATLAFAMGGMVRERSKSPDTVYGQIVKPEITVKEADRYLLYDKLLGDDLSPKDLMRRPQKDWGEFVDQRRRSGQVSLTDEQARRLVKYLQEHYR